MKRFSFILLALTMLILAAGPAAPARADYMATPTLLPIELDPVTGVLKISWINNDPNSVSYKVERRPNGAPWEPAVTTTDCFLYQNAATFPEPENTYFYAVQAFGSNLITQYSLATDGQTSIYVGTFIPEPPGALNGEATSPNSVKLSWEDTCPWENSVAVFYSVHGSNQPQQNLNVAAGLTSVSVDGLESGIAYDFCLKAVSAHGQSDPSNTITITTDTSLIPGFSYPNNNPHTSNLFWDSPSDLIAQALPENTIELQWTDGCSNETGFRIMRQDDANANMEPLAITDPDAVSFVDDTVQSGQTYVYEVCAIYPNGDSVYSNTATATAPSGQQQDGVTSCVLRFRIGDATFYSNGNPVVMDAAPISIEGRILLPIRFVVEELGGTANWIANTAVISCNGHVLNLWLNQNTATVDGLNKMIDPGNTAVVPVESNSRIMVPLRFVGENIGCGAVWDPDTWKRL